MTTTLPETRPAQREDFPAIITLLTACHLPTSDLNADLMRNFVVATSGNTLVGVCGLEVFESAGLPRSLAVEPAWRGQGVGEHLLDENERRASAQGVNALYLLTSTAHAYLLRLGYEDVSRDAVPAAIATHPQFRGLCPASAKCMRKLLK